MKKIHILLGLIVTMFTMTSLIPPSEEDWQFDLQDGFLQVSYTDSFTNKKKELCAYYINSANLLTINSTINNKLTEKSGKLLFKLNYGATIGLFGADGNQFVTCDGTKNDTLMGSLTISIGKSSLKLVGTKNSFNTIKCKIRVILTDKNKISMKFIGFTVTDLNVKAMKGKSETVETDMETLYNDFLISTKRDKFDEDFFRDLKMIIGICHDVVVAQLQKDIKINELD